MNDREHGAEDRLRDALHAQAQADDISTDAWAKIRGGVNARATRRRTAVWASLGLAGAAAAVIAVIGFAALNADGDKQVVDTPDDTDTGIDVSAKIPIDTAYLPGVGFTETLAADDTGVWVVVANDQAAGSTGIAHISLETDEVDETADVAGVQSLLLLDGDLWYSRGDSVGRFTEADPGTGTEAVSSIFEAQSAGEFRGELVATDSSVWTIVGQSSVASFDRDGGTAQGEIELGGTVQRIVALGDDLWVESDALPNTLSRLDTDTEQLVDGVELPERNAVTYAVADNTIWTIDSSGNLVPLVGKRTGDAPLATGIPTGRFVPTDEGLAVSGLDDRQLHLYGDDLSPRGGLLELEIPDRGGLDGPWGGLVIAGDIAWWQNAAGPSVLRFDLGE